MRAPSTIMAEIAALVAADADIQAWCQAQYSRPLQSLIGIDDEAMPPDSTMPFLAMRPGSYLPATDRSHRLVTVAFSLVIKEAEDDATWFSQAGTVRTMAALAKLEDLYRRVETLLEGYISSHYNGQAAYGEGQTEISMPLVRLTWSLTFEENIN